MALPGTLVRLALAVYLALSTPAVEAAARCAQPSDSHRGPRTLVLALDGIPLRVMERAREAGAFADWAPPRRMVATFPSMTNVSFSAMLAPYGADPAAGYELQYFDWAQNQVVGGTPFGYKDRVFSWRDYFDVVSRSLGSKLSGYTTPGRHSRHELELIAEQLLSGDQELVLVHMGATDAMQHIMGDDPVVEFLLHLDEWLEEMDRQSVERSGAPLRVVLLSDHGNSLRKISSIGPIRRALKAEGFDTDGRLRQDNDVVAATFGLAGFGAVFTESQNAARAGQALAGAKFVDVVAWPSGEREIRVLSGKKRAARILWREGAEGAEMAYVAEYGDPLRLQSARAGMAAAGLLDADGFARDRDWLRFTEESRYPDALRRLVDAFTGDHVENHATVLFSARPGRAWGWKAGHVGSWFRGGRLEGTHGGLDDESSIGFWMSRDPRDDPGGPVRAAEALLPFQSAWQRVHCKPEADTLARTGAGPDSTASSSSSSAAPAEVRDADRPEPRP